VIVEIKLQGDSAQERTYDDRILVVRAASEVAARRKAEAFARADEDSYADVHGKIVRWRFKEVVETCELLADELRSGTEVYSTFIGFDRLQELRRRPPSVWAAYRRAHPSADPRHVTVGEVVEWAERPAREAHALVVRAHEAYVRAHSKKDASKLTVRELLAWYAQGEERSGTRRGVESHRLTSRRSKASR